MTYSVSAAERQPRAASTGAARAPPRQTPSAVLTVSSQCRNGELPPAVPARAVTTCGLAAAMVDSLTVWVVLLALVDSLTVRVVLMAMVTCCASGLCCWRCSRARPRSFCGHGQADPLV